MKVKFDAMIKTTSTSVCVIVVDSGGKPSIQAHRIIIGTQMGEIAQCVYCSVLPRTTYRYAGKTWIDI